jgi:glycosyltransferase involved in cell wall biosynthesis
MQDTLTVFLFQFFRGSYYFVISAIIPTYNRADFLSRAIGSVISQTRPPDELIIVDDGSTDGSVDIINVLKNSTFIPMHYIYQQNKGASAARNLGIKHSKYQVLAFLDSDDWWHREKLEKQLAHMVQYPNYLISHTREIWFRHGKRVNQKKKHDPPNGDIFFKSLRMCMVGMSTVMIKKTLFDQFGLFDESFPCCEDYDLWLRVGASLPFLLVEERLTCKNGGRDDQLSSLYRMGMDRYRIKSLCTLLESGALSETQKKQTLQELDRKCTIYGKGCLKRGRKEEGERYLHIPNKYVAGDGSSDDG